MFASLLLALVTLLPEDGRFYTTVFSDGSPKSNQIINEFNVTPELKTLKAQSTFNVVTTSDPRYVRYPNADAPSVVIQDKDGKVLFKASGANLPGKGSDLVAMIRAKREVERCRPGPTPSPAPEPAPVPDTVPDILAPSVPDSEIKPDGLDLWLKVVIAVSAVGFAIWPELKKKYTALDVKPPE